MNNIDYDNYTKVTITNDIIWKWSVWSSDPYVIDGWLDCEIGRDNYCEFKSAEMRPYRVFGFKNPEDATRFALKWL